MRKLPVTCLILFLAMIPVWSQAADLSRAEAAPMEAYLGRFMGISRDNMRFGSPAQAAEARKMLEYALRFAQQDDPGKFSQCPRENCPYGKLRVEKRYVDEAIKRYFGLDPDRYPFLSGQDWPGFERGFYHVAESPESLGIRPRVREAKEQPVGLVLMRGDVLDHMGEVIDKFTALAWPAKFGTQNTWSLVSLTYDSAKKKK